MNGVEILNTIYEYDCLMHPVWFLLFGFGSLIICILGMCTIGHYDVQRVLKFLLVIMVLGVVVCGICAAIETDEVIDIKYQVTVSEEVNMVEFMENYEIVDQEGKIYTVRERD